MIDRNPITDIQKAVERKREVLIPDDVYVAITEHLLVHKLNRRTYDGTWRAKICDLIYMMSQQPIDVFGLKETQINDDGGEFGEITFSRHKTGVGILLEMNAEPRQLVDWFRNWKREQAGHYLAVSDGLSALLRHAQPHPTGETSIYAGVLGASW